MRVLLVAAALLTGSAPALAADPTGDWLVAAKVAQIRIENCDGAMWGAVVWEKEPGGRDTQNPDPAKRSRPTLGMPILLDMKPAGTSRWEGRVYNAQNGKSYSATITLPGPDTLRIQGCVFGILCGGESWTRVQAEPLARAPSTGSTTGRSAPAAPPRDPKQFCSSVLGIAGPAH